MRIKPGFILKEAAGESVAIPFDGEYEERGAILALNSTGAFLWQLMQQECSAEELKTALAEKYGIDNELAEKAVSGFVEELRKENLLENEN